VPHSLRRALGIAALLLILVQAACSPRRAPDAWQAIAIPTDAEFTGMWFADSLNGWITGGGYLIDGGIVGRTRDGGRSWRFRSGVQADGGTGFSLNRVQFRDTLRGCAAASGGLVLLTDDGGKSWRPARGGSSASDFLFDVQFVDERNGWSIGPARILRTDDGGESWRTLVRAASENGYLSGNAIHFVDLEHGWLVGRGGAVMRSDDGGLHWTAVPMPLHEGERPTLWDVTFVGGNDGWIVGELGVVFHTNDGGATWSRQEKGIPVERAVPRGEPRPPHEIAPDLQVEPSRLSLTSVSFANARDGCAVGHYNDVGESVVLATRDGGGSWRVERVEPGEALRAVFTLDPRHAWAVGDRVRTAPQVVLRRTHAAP